MPDRRIAVFCSSMPGIDEAHLEEARSLGRLIAREGWDLIYGGTTTGMMHVLAQSVRAGGGRTIGVIPHHFLEKNMADPDETACILVADLRERKAEMERLADAFIALPGGLGTLDEIIEILSLRQLGLHAKPILFINHKGLYDPLLDLFDQMIDGRLARHQITQWFHVAPDASSAVDWLRTALH